MILVLIVGLRFLIIIGIRALVRAVSRRRSYHVLHTRMVVEHMRVHRRHRATLIVRMRRLVGMMRMRLLIVGAAAHALLLLWRLLWMLVAMEQIRIGRMEGWMPMLEVRILVWALMWVW